MTRAITTASAFDHLLHVPAEESWVYSLPQAHRLESHFAPVTHVAANEQAWPTLATETIQALSTFVLVAFVVGLITKKVKESKFWPKHPSFLSPGT